MRTTCFGFFFFLQKPSSRKTIIKDQSIVLRIVSAERKYVWFRISKHNGIADTKITARCLELPKTLNYSDYDSFLSLLAFVLGYLKLRVLESHNNRQD